MSFAKFINRQTHSLGREVYMSREDAFPPGQFLLALEGLGSLGRKVHVFGSASFSFSSVSSERVLKPSPFDAKGHVMLYITHREEGKCVNSKALSSSRDLKIGNTEHLGNVL